jgi:hypothetical protein
MDLSWTCRRPTTGESAQRSCLVESFGLTTSVAEVAVVGKGLLQVPGRALVISCLPPHGPEISEGVGLAEPVADVTVDGQTLLKLPGRA